MIQPSANKSIGHSDGELAACPKCGRALPGVCRSTPSGWFCQQAGLVLDFNRMLGHPDPEPAHVRKAISKHDAPVLKAAADAAAALASHESANAAWEEAVREGQRLFSKFGDSLSYTADFQPSAVDPSVVAQIRASRETVDELWDVRTLTGEALGRARIALGKVQREVSYAKQRAAYVGPEGGLRAIASKLGLR
jgi:hypothetical protein